MILSMKHIPTFVLVVFLFLGAIPASADAYFTTAQNAFTVDNQTGVFTIDFAFGHKNYDVYIPVHAVRSGTPSLSELSYTIQRGNNETVKGSSVGIVLSGAHVKNGMYVIPKGTSATFRLLVIFTKDSVDTGNAYTLTVTHLPFSFNGTQQLKLNPSELQYYATKPLVLGGHMGVSVRDIKVFYTTLPKH